MAPQSGPVVVTQSPQFDPNSRRFLCCCACCRCCCHVRNGVIALSVWEVLGCIAGVVSLVMIFVQVGGFDSFNGEGDFAESQDRARHYFGFALAAIIAFVAFLIVAILTCVSVRQERPLLLLPHLVLQVIAILTVVAVIIFGIVGIVQSTIYSDTNSYWQILCIIIPFLAALCWQIWFFVATLKCYRYLTEKRVFEARRDVEMARVAK